MDITYVEDFLLTYRTFIKDSKTIADQLLVWFDEEKYRAKVCMLFIIVVHFKNYNYLN